MKVKDLIFKGITKIAENLNSQVYSNEEKTMFYFLYNGWLIVIGLKKIGSNLDFFDLRCRIFLGVQGKEFDPFSVLRFNNFYGEIYGCSSFNIFEIITLTSDYRLLLSWENNFIIDVIAHYFGGFISNPMPKIDILSLSSDYYFDMLNNYSLQKLLHIKEIMNKEKIECIINN